MTYQVTNRVPFQEPYRTMPQNFFTHTEEVGDGTDSDHYMDPDAEPTSV